MSRLVWQDVFRALVDLALGLARNGSDSAPGHVEVGAAIIDATLVESAARARTHIEAPSLRF